jgi:hypothetical protein
MGGAPKLKPSQWYNVDGFTDRNSFAKAALHNLLALNTEAYVNITERADFYQWFQEATAVKGFQTRWAGAASKVASAVGLIAGEVPMTPPPITNFFTDLFGFATDDVRNFSYEGNKAIFNDALPKLKQLYLGPVPTGTVARRIDEVMLMQEQTLVQPIYLAQSKKNHWSFAGWC